MIAYFLGKAWANLLPRGDKFEARWRARGGQGTPPLWIRIVSFFNYGPWNLKEHAICAITATSASNAAETITVFAAQDLFYGIPLSAATVVLAVISIGLFGYGLCGILRPIMVWHPESVYWGSLPTVKTLQGLHWQDLKSSAPLRYFWYAFGSMFAYEFFPAYIFPWLNSVSIPCLAAMNATGSKAAVLTNLFGGATNNEGLGLFTLSFDWQYVSLKIPGSSTDVKKGADLDQSHRLRPSTLPSLLKRKLTASWDTSSALLPCSVFTIRMLGMQKRNHSCQPNFDWKMALGIPPQKSSITVYSTKRPWRSLVTQV